MKGKDLTKKFMLFQIDKKHFGLNGIYKSFSVMYELRHKL